MTEQVQKAAKAVENTLRGQRWAGYACTAVAVLVICVGGVRFSLGEFGVMDTMAAGRAWLAMGLGLSFALSGAAFSQVSVGGIGARLLEKISPGVPGT